MPREIVWLPDAAKDVARLRNFIQEKNPNAASRAASRIKEAAQILIENPEAGKPLEETLPFRDLFYSIRKRQLHSALSGRAESGCCGACSTQ